MMRNLRDKRFMKSVLWVLVFVFVSFIFLAWGMRSQIGNTGKESHFKGQGGRYSNY